MIKISELLSGFVGGTTIADTHVRMRRLRI